MDKLKYTNPINSQNGSPMSQEFNETTVNVVTGQGPKILGVWAAIGISSWSDAAAFLAFVLSALALSEYLWKKLIRPALAAMGVCKPAKTRRKMIAVEETDE